MKRKGDKCKSILLVFLVSTLVVFYFRNNNITEIRNTKFREYDVVVVGAGLSGAVMAHLHAALLHKRVIVIEKRNHVGGNCYDSINDVGIRVSKYGAHLFHTKHETVWNFVQQFSSWTGYEHRVVANVDGKYAPVPVNIDTVNTLLNTSISTTQQMKQWLNKNQVHNNHPQDGEEAALSRVGDRLYHILFKPYTYKQWAKYPKQLNASVLLRIPVSDSFDDRYFPNDKYQALPTEGYTTFVKNMLQHPNIMVLLNHDYFKIKNVFKEHIERTIYTGPIDQYFSDSDLPKLEYRSINFESVTLYNTSFYQPNSVVNYPQGPENFTRIVEYKHFLAQKSLHTTIVKEFSSVSGDPYYPVPNTPNQILYSKYKHLAKKTEMSSKVHFVGRLANYKYYNMDQSILNAINTFESIHRMVVPIPIKHEDNVPSKKSFTLIVNHCNENLDWLHDLKSLYKMFETKIELYQKCNQTTTPQGKDLPEIHQFTLPNVGREGHSWLDFILSKQSLYSKMNLFIQGKPHLNMSKYLQSVKDSFEKGLEYTVYNVGSCARLEDTVSKKIFPFFLDAELSCRWVRKFTNTRNCKVIPSFVGEFIVSEIRLRRTLAKHRTPLMEMHDELAKENNPVLGHLLERMWKTVFAGAELCG